MRTIVLNIDDAEPSRYARTRVLEAAGFTVREGSSGKDALAMSLAEAPGAIVLDIRLPDIDGFSVCRMLKRNPGTAGIPLIHVSAVGIQEQDYPSALESGADAYLREPIDPTVLVATVRALIRARAAEADASAAHVQLERATRLARLAQRAARCGAWEWNVETNELVWSDEYRALFGIPATTPATLERFWLLIHEEDRERVKADIAKVIENPVPEFRSEFRAALSSGVRWMERRGQVITDAEGKAIRLIGISTDITDRKRLEQERDIAERRLKGLTHALNLAQSMIRKPDGTILVWNDGAARMYGWTREEATGKHVHELLQTEFEVPLEQIETKLLRAGEWHGEFKHYRKDGTCLYVASHCVLTIGEDDAPVVIETNNDISEQKRLERALRSSNEDLQRFAYAASHDLQEPLRTIGLYSEMLLRRNQSKMDAESHGYIDFILDGTARMRRLIGGLLEYAQLTDDDSAARRPADMNAVLNRATQQVNAMIAETGATVTSDPLPVVVGDEERLAQVLQNLIANSIKYRGAEPPRIHVSVRVSGDEWYFSVRDNGIGFDPKYAERVFGVFKRLHTNREVEGTGLGLAIVKRIIERHGGRVWAESMPGTGSTFSFSLPASRSIPE